MFILYFIIASIITTIAVNFGVPAAVFNPLKTLSKFFIVLAMSAIGLNTNIVKLVKTGAKPLLLGFSCWIGITCMSLLMQRVLGRVVKLRIILIGDAVFAPSIFVFWQIEALSPSESIPQTQSTTGFRFSSKMLRLTASESPPDSRPY